MGRVAVIGEVEAPHSHDVSEIEVEAPAAEVVHPDSPLATPDAVIGWDDLSEPDRADLLDSAVVADLFPNASVQDDICIPDSGNAADEDDPNEENNLPGLLGLRDVSVGEGEHRDDDGRKVDAIGCPSVLCGLSCPGDADGSCRA